MPTGDQHIIINDIFYNVNYIINQNVERFGRFVYMHHVKIKYIYIVYMLVYIGRQSADVCTRMCNFVSPVIFEINNNDIPC